MVPEAKLQETDEGLVPAGEGWFVLNARDARWGHSPDFGRSCAFESPEARFAQLGLNIRVLEPGKPNCMYHGEEAQEGFLVLSGEAILVVEGQERRLRAWDYVHLPPWTEHVLVGAGDGPCVVVAVGGRPAPGIRYPPNETAARHGACVSEETDSPAEAYARFSPRSSVRYVEGTLPQL